MDSRPGRRRMIYMSRGVAGEDLTQFGYFLFKLFKKAFMCLNPHLQCVGTVRGVCWVIACVWWRVALPLAVRLLIWTHGVQVRVETRRVAHRLENLEREDDRTQLEGCDKKKKLYDIMQPRWLHHYWSSLFQGQNIISSFIHQYKIE